jgi:hypothetical protein
VADNVPITAGSGTDIATDQVTTTGEHVQLFKIAISADGDRTLIPATAADGLLVDISNASVPIGDGTNTVTVDTDPTDGEANSGNALHVEGRTYVYNGTTWDRARGNISNGLLPSRYDNTNTFYSPTVTETGGGLKISSPRCTRTPTRSTAPVC